MAEDFSDRNFMKLKKIIILAILLFVFSFLFSGFAFSQSNVPPCPTLSMGSQGDCVKFLQQSLNTLISAGLAVDGIFGSATQSAVKTFQSQKGIKVDGVVGAQTWSAISAALGNQQQSGYSLPPLPPGQGLTTSGLLGTFTKLANFLIAAGVILAIITIVISGIMYFWAGSDAEAKNAKGWFKNGLIGAIIILGVGVIINTVALVVSGGFFGTGGGGGGGGGGGSPGSPCVTSGDCNIGTTCNLSTGICIRVGGNVEGESCKDDSDCKSGLICKKTGIFGTGPKQCKNP